MCRKLQSLLRYATENKPQDILCNPIQCFMQSYENIKCCSLFHRNYDVKAKGLRQLSQTEYQINTREYFNYFETSETCCSVILTHQVKQTKSKTQIDCPETIKWHSLYHSNSSMLLVKKTLSRPLLITSDNVFGRNYNSH